MELSNKRTIYSVKNENLQLKLEGEVTINEVLKEIVSFSGNFMKLDTLDYIGSFTFNESESTYNKNISRFPIELGDSGELLLDATIESIKSQMTIK